MEKQTGKERKKEGRRKERSEEQKRSEGGK